ncbi:nephrin isoform A [Alligator mississippiensis]|uniref:Nephrin isoform A n=1 Tax=Alligator mississippiensis TaxID=8496 RepID=A0A151NLC3_ALLMI|nr:nephrin isoform A [Alligator mississippiensis]
MNTFYQLDVKYPPEFSAEQPELVVGQEHGAVELPLLVSGNPPDLTCTWSFRGKDLIPEGSPRHHQVGPGKSLAVWNVTRADAGPYRAQCSNEEGANETLLHLLVHYAPSIRSLSDPTVVAEGAAAEIVCMADAVPAPPNMFQWTWLGPEERDLDDLEAVAAGAVGRLRVPAARRDQAGRYECRVDNGVGAPARASARLVVHFPPELERGPGWEKVAAPGDRLAMAVLRCRARGVPGVELSWTKDGTALDPEEPRYSTRSWREGPWYRSDLVIANVSAAADYAMFTCTAANTLGSARLDVQLLSTSHPDPPTGLQVVGVTPTSVSLAWTPGFDGGLRQQFRIRYRWPGAPSASYVDVFPGAASAFTLTSLHPGMPYSLAVTSRNALGESPPTPELHITTHELLGEPPPEEEPTLPEEGSFALPLLGGLGAVGGGLLLSNAALVLCMLRRRRGASEGMAERKKLSAENHYSSGEAVNPGARRTLLLDSGSEGSALSFGSRRPGLYPHPETPQDTGPTPWPYPPHHYEDLLEPYEEVGVSPAPPSRWGLAPWGGPEDPWGIYDRVAETALPGPGGVSELPFELRGELV